MARHEPRVAADRLELAGDYRLRLGFADALFREVGLGPEYWSTTGLEIHPERFRSARIDIERNRLVWSNGFADSGEGSTWPSWRVTGQDRYVTG